MPKFSVIIPVYNVEKFLRLAVDSVLAQTFKNYEIILVDDGSTDSCPSICDEYAENNDCIRVIHQENNGLGGARNTGIYEAKSELLLFLDSDDTFHPRLLEICNEKIEKYGCDTVFFNLIAVYEGGEKGAVYTQQLEKDRLLTGEDLKPLAFLTGACNRVFKKDLFIKNNIEFPNRVWYEDLRTIGKFAFDTKTAYYYTEEPLYYYFQREGSIMHSRDFDRLVEERTAAVNEIWDYYKEKGEDKNYAEELEFLMLYHGYFLPVRELQQMTRDFKAYAKRLKENLLSHCKKPLGNKYLSLLSKKEKMLFNWAFGEKYFTIRIFSDVNRLVKRIRNAK